MAYLTDEYWKKERAKEQARRRQEEIKTKVMRVHTNNPELNIREIAELLGTTQRVVKNCLGANIARRLEEREKNSQIENETKDVKPHKGVKLTEKRVDGIIAKRDEQILKMHEEDISASVIAEKLRMELGQVLEVFYRHSITPYTKSELEQIEKKKSKKDEEENITTAEDILRIMRKYNSDNQPEKVVSFAKKMLAEADFLTDEQRQKLKQIIDTINNRKNKMSKEPTEEGR